jgi:hypothetical protein
MPLPNPDLFKKVQNYEPVYGGIQFGGEEGTQTIRPSSTALFCISSVDRYANIGDRRVVSRQSSPYRFTITKNESLLNGFFTRMALTEIKFPWTLPNVSASSFTNLIGITCGTDSHVITIPDGFYTAPELAATITSTWNTLYTTNTILMEVNPNLNDGSFLLTPVTGGSLVAVYPAGVGTTPSLPLNTFQLVDMMGFINLNSVPAALQLSYGTPNLLWTEYVDIVATNLTYNQALKDSSSSQATRDIIYRIYLTETEQSYNYPKTTAAQNTYFGQLPYGTRPFVIYRQFQNPKEIRWNKQQPIGQVTFEVYDDKGRNLADLFGSTPYGNLYSADWNMTMLVSEN